MEFNLNKDILSHNNVPLEKPKCTPVWKPLIYTGCREREREREQEIYIHERARESKRERERERARYTDLYKIYLNSI